MVVYSSQRSRKTSSRKLKLILAGIRRNKLISRYKLMQINACRYFIVNVAESYIGFACIFGIALPVYRLIVGVQGVINFCQKFSVAVVCSYYLYTIYIVIVYYAFFIAGRFCNLVIVRAFGSVKEFREDNCSVSAVHSLNSSSGGCACRAVYRSCRKAELFIGQSFSVHSLKGFKQNISLCFISILE